MLQRVGMAALGSPHRFLPCEQPEVVRHVEWERLELCSGQAPMRLGSARLGRPFLCRMHDRLVSLRCV
jgi:hypothetical protein